MVDIYRSSDFDELEAARLHGDDAPVVTKDVERKAVEQVSAPVADASVEG